MFPNGNAADTVAQQQSFSLANIVPQVHENNSGIWSGIEAAVRQLATDEGELYIVTGPAFIGTQVQQIGRGVLVPTHIWKAVYSPRQRAAGVYLITNDDTREYSVLSLAELARLAGVDPLPALPQKVKDTAMKLPKPIGRGAGGRRKTAPAADDEFRLKEFVRSVLERFGGNK